jgi:hypothetical protein
VTSSCTDLGLSSPRANGTTNGPDLRVSAYGVGGPDGVDARVWSKANWIGTCHEPRLIWTLGRLLPDPVPEVPTIDTERAWSLTRDVGATWRSSVSVPDQWPCGSALGTDRPGQFSAGDQRGNPGLVMAIHAARDPTTNHREYDLPRYVAGYTKCWPARSHADVGTSTALRPTTARGGYGFRCWSKKSTVRRRASIADGSWNCDPVSLPNTAKRTGLSAES